VRKKLKYNEGTFIRLIHNKNGKIGSWFQTSRELKIVEQGYTNMVGRTIIILMRKLNLLPMSVKMDNIYDTVLSNKDT